ncbi:hypothetical protein MHC_02205 [Mycoplasma haemocanis str. Illinois]|uniref:Uncharacterized protein n=1 Tax=Mycoplasma haemocanis (strain Illinois) TaxID=1111676 RepID=H6N6N5_MYCHN|nr:hypothetical protein MHC_02205 [Mycoplasma haemocanis str. Illinois]
MQDINRKGPDNIPEGLKQAYEWKDQPHMAERWAALFCEDGPQDINETNYKDYQEYCNGY